MAFIREAFERDYLMDPHTATCLKTCRAAEFADKINIVYSTAEWTKFAPVIDSAINGNRSVDDFDALQSIAATAGVEIPDSILQLFDLPVAHPAVVEKAAIEAQIIEFLEAGA